MYRHPGRVTGGVCAALSIVLILGVAKCEARHGMDHGQWAKKPDQGIECYECNSEYDPRCADPFDPYTIGVVNCSKKRPLGHLLNQKPTLCRKTVQKVQGKIRVIRGCGYILDERERTECVKRTGTHDVHVTYCSCTGQNCNTGNSKLGYSTTSITILATAVLLAISS